jgi:apolipoprotein N-acyltransferase
MVAMNRYPQFTLICLTLMSAVLLPLALPNEIFVNGNPLLGLFALSFYFLALYHTPSFDFAAALGVTFGVVSTVLANYWLSNFGEYSVWTLGGVTLGYIGYNALLALFLYGFIKIKPRYRVLLLAAVWAVYEYLKSSGFLGYPWGLIAYPVHTILPLVQFVDITGLWGLSFLMAYINALGAEILERLFPAVSLPGGPISRTIIPRDRRPLPWTDHALFAAALVALALGYGALRMLVPVPVEREVDMLLIQQNKDPWRRGMSDTSIKAARDLTMQGIAESLQKYGKRPDLIAWNETSLRYVGRADLEFFKSTRCYNLIGAPVTISTEPYSAYNASILISPEGEPLAFYAKQHPVPFVESIPFWNLPLVREFFQQVVGIGSFWSMGDEFTVFTLPLPDGGTLRFGTPICFEDVFPDLCRRFFLDGAGGHPAELLINMSNDSWSKTTSALTQHLAAARFRAVENRRTLVRATNAGITSVIDAYGAVIASIPVFEPNYLLTRVPVYAPRAYTPYTLFGDYVAYALALIILAVLAEYALGPRLLEFLMRGNKRGRTGNSGTSCRE